MRCALKEALRAGFVPRRYSSLYRCGMGLAFLKDLIFCSCDHNELNILCEQYRGWVKTLVSLLGITTLNADQSEVFHTNQVPFEVWYLHYNGLIYVFCLFYNYEKNQAYIEICSFECVKVVETVTQFLNGGCAPRGSGDFLCFGTGFKLKWPR